MIILDTNPTNYANLTEEVEEEALNMLATFIDKAWAKFDSEEPSVDDYYNYM